MATKIKAKKEISQESLAELLQLQHQEDDLQKSLKLLQVQIGAREEGIIAQLETGLRVAEGLLKAEVKIQEIRRPSWKAIFVAEHGEAEAEKIIEQTPPSVSKKLRVF